MDWLLSFLDKFIYFAELILMQQNLHNNQRAANYHTKFLIFIRLSISFQSTEASWFRSSKYFLPQSIHSKQPLGVMPLMFQNKGCGKLQVELLTINLQTFEFPSMYKTKHIYKPQQHREDRLHQKRTQECSQPYASTSDSDEESSSGELQQLDFSYAPCQQEEYSIEHFIQHLQPEQESDLQESEQQQRGFCFLGMGSELQRINAIYMQRMRCSGAVGGSAIRFDPVVRVKFFSDQSPAVDVYSAKQYAINQFLQTPDEDRMA